jgi:hypothetical protein
MAQEATLAENGEKDRSRSLSEGRGKRGDFLDCLKRRRRKTDD